MAANPRAPDRNLAMELVRVTEAAAMAAGRWMGRGDKEGADGAAVHAMRVVLQTVAMDGVVVIGEGEKDHAPMLYNGEHIGDGSPPPTDIAVDPIDGTNLASLGRGGALAVIAVSERGTMFNPGPCFYMEKLAVGPKAVGSVDIRRSATENIEAVAKALGKSVRDVTVVILDRERHTDLIDEVRGSGARIKLITDGDVAGAISAAWPDSGVDVLLGVGGTPEGVLAAAALKSMGGEIQGRLWPRNDEERRSAQEAGYDLDAVLGTDDLVKGDNCFFAATAITDGELLQGVRYHDYGATTQSLVMRSRSGTVRFVERAASSRQAAGVQPDRVRLSDAGHSATSFRRVSTYPLRNDTAQEAARLEALQHLHDASTIRRFERLGVGPGWHCAELGAGAGSIAEWLAERVGPAGSVTAVDRDTSQLARLRRLGNVRVVEGDLTSRVFADSVFAPEHYDLVHSRSVLMHIDDADAVVARVVPALRRGGVVFFEEADGAPVVRALSERELPEPFVRVMAPLASRWTWARGLAGRLAALGLEQVHDDVRQDDLVGATPAAMFWRRTLETIRPLVTDGPGMRALGRAPIDDASYDAMLGLLGDPGFSVPFAARHRVSARKP